jgi:hypothetical protein
MPEKSLFRLYLRSRLNKGLSIAAGALIVLAILFLRPYVAVPILVILAAWAALTGALFFSRRGAREVVAEREEDRLSNIQEKITAFAQMRERISVLRIGDERMAKAIEYFLQESGSYLEKCRELRIYSPFANERIERVQEICQVFLGELDESATGRRYGAQEEGQPPVEPAERFAKDIMECASVIKTRTVEDLLGLSGAARLAIMKELEEKK